MSITIWFEEFQSGIDGINRQLLILWLTKTAEKIIIADRTPENDF